MKSDDTGQSTAAVHAGSQKPAPGEPVVTPVYHAATFFTDAEPVGGRAVRAGDQRPPPPQLLPLEHEDEPVEHVL